MEYWSAGMLERWAPDSLLSRQPGEDRIEELAKIFSSMFAVKALSDGRSHLNRN
jgi:hypothetical protein